jgi:hypothetical protein
MPKMIEQWLLFKYVGGEFTPLSKQQAEKARRKYPERQRKTIGGVEYQRAERVT